MKSSQILIEKFKKQAQDSKSWRLPLAIGIWTDRDDIVGSFCYNNSAPYDPQEDVEIDDYKFNEELAIFPVYAVDHDESSFTFKCKFALDDEPSKDVVTLREAMLIDFDLNDFDTFYIELYGKKYEIVADGAEFINETLEDGKTYTQFIYIDTLPMIDLDNTSWANYYAQKAWEDEQQDVEDIAKADYYDYMNESGSFCTYTIKFLTQNNIGQTNRMDVDATSVEDAMKSFNEEFENAFPRDVVIEIVSIAQDGRMMSKSIVDRMNASYLAECDGGAAAAGGDAGGAASAGDSGGTADGTSAPAAEVADASGIKASDVLGKCDHHKDGYMGPGCFHVPSRVAVPLYRWGGAAYGGSKRKNKKKKTAYEQGMKTVVNMFEADASKMWTYREFLLECDHTLKDYKFSFISNDAKSQLQAKIPEDAVYFKPDDQDGYDECMFIDFASRDEAVRFALQRNHDYLVMANDVMEDDFDDPEEYNEWYEDQKYQFKKNEQSIKSNGTAEYSDGQYTQWECAIYEKEMNLDEDGASAQSKIDQNKINKKLAQISKRFKDMDDIEGVAADFQRKKDSTLAKIPDDNKFKEMKKLFIDFGNFLVDICRGEWKASWFTITMVAVGLVYVLSPVDLIPDVLPVVGLIDDAFVISMIHHAIKDEFDEWKAANTI